MTVILLPLYHTFLSCFTRIKQSHLLLFLHQHRRSDHTREKLNSSLLSTLTTVLIAFDVVYNRMLIYFLFAFAHFTLQYVFRSVIHFQTICILLARHSSSGKTFLVFKSLEHSHILHFQTRILGFRSNSNRFFHMDALRKLYWKINASEKKHGRPW